VLEHRGLRFLVEALILAAVATAAAVASFRPLVIVGVMVLAWAVVALLEWAFLRGESHFASGLPPRYYVPPLALPAPREPVPQASETRAPMRPSPPEPEPEPEPPTSSTRAPHPDATNATATIHDARSIMSRHQRIRPRRPRRARGPA